ncbi:MAG: hypothetical protein N2C14_31930 [Planctomycetales bacterium]
MHRETLFLGALHCQDSISLDAERGYHFVGNARAIRQWLKEKRGHFHAKEHIGLRIHVLQASGWEQIKQSFIRAGKAVVGVPDIDVGAAIGLFSADLLMDPSYQDFVDGFQEAAEYVLDAEPEEEDSESDNPTDGEKQIAIHVEVSKGFGPKTGVCQTRKTKLNCRQIGRLIGVFLKARKKKVEVNPALRKAYQNCSESSGWVERERANYDPGRMRSQAAEDGFWC